MNEILLLNYSMNPLSVSTKTYSYVDFKPLFNGPVKVALTKLSERNIIRSNKLLNNKLKEGKTIYGVNTGFGNLSHIRIEKKNLTKLQINLARSHASGIGKPLDLEIVRTVFYLKLLTFAKGYSGVRINVVKKIIQFLNKDILPVIPRKGSVGASGDLNPLGHMTLSLIGEGEVFYNGERMSTETALNKARVKPLVLYPKEGLSLINGTQLSTAIAIKALIDGENLLKIADVSGALSVENSFSSREVFQKNIHELKSHPGQVISARNVFNMLKGSEIVKSHKSHRKIQDPYSFRCIPHIHGACRDSFANALQMVNNEINSVSDNPLILFDGNIVNSGHFHAEHISQSMDQLSISFTELGAISERRVHFFMKGIGSLIPPFVTKTPGIESGYMMSHVTATSLASENKTLSHPASIDSLPTSGGQEDLVSMAPWAGYKLIKIQKNLSIILAVELIVAGAANQIASQNKMPGKGTIPVLKQLKKYCSFEKGDRSLEPEIREISKQIHTGKLLHIIENFIKVE
tara:strand:- start:722 stop:2278 length:1557 start_codon:yes stop_codon:yes gene_type:complete